MAAFTSVAAMVLFTRAATPKGDIESTDSAAPAAVAL